MKKIALSAVTCISLFSGCAISCPNISQEDAYVIQAERSLKPQQELADALREFFKDPDFKQAYAQFTEAQLTGEVTTYPRIRHMVKPRYPERNLIAGKETRVFVGVVVDERGAVETMQVVAENGWSLNDEFLSSIKEAVGQWQFKPGTRNDVPVKSVVVTPLIFDLR